MAADFENHTFAAIDRYFAGRYTKRYGLVTSWDPDKHLAKVTFQPEGQESGWIPVHTMAAANGVGHMTGLTPGDGVSTGDQVEVTYQEGEFGAGAITSRVHSDVDVPPKVESGEQLFKTPFGSSTQYGKDGSITHTDKAGSIIKMDGVGGIAITCTTLTINASGEIKLTGNPVTING